MRNALLREIKEAATSAQLLPVQRSASRRGTWRTVPRLFSGGFAICAWVMTLHAQSSGPGHSGASANDIQAMQERISNLETEVAELKAMIKQLHPAASITAVSTSSLASAFSVPVKSTVPEGASQNQSADQDGVLQSADKKTLEFLRGTTLDLGLDTYYEYNFNHPVGRVNLLRAYDVLSNEFSLNQASVIFDHPPDLADGRRWGGRLDLQFGQATDTLQGNPLNEPRPEIYRNIFQAYGTYVLPVGQGVTVDFGKWASSLGIEGNYTKDQMNYSRSYWFDFLPFYQMGVRATIPLNDRFTVNYWVVNGTNQAEATNGFKDELFGFTAKPVKAVSWTLNYYLGQDHPDRIVVTPTGPIPVQPGLGFEAIRPAPDGRTHIFDSYVTWQATPKLYVRGGRRLSDRTALEK
jgi:Putative beta-barrel porin-2, OmpL-like. bbp2